MKQDTGIKLTFEEKNKYADEILELINHGNFNEKFSANELRTMRAVFKVIKRRKGFSDLGLEERLRQLSRATYRRLKYDKRGCFYFCYRVAKNREFIITSIMKEVVPMNKSVFESGKPAPAKLGAVPNAPISAAQPSGFQGRVETFEKELSMLRDAFANLARAIEPVLREPTPTAETAILKDDSSASALERWLTTQTSEIRDLREHMLSLYDRCSL